MKCRTFGASIAAALAFGMLTMGSSGAAVSRDERGASAASCNYSVYYACVTVQANVPTTVGIGCAFCGQWTAGVARAKNGKPAKKVQTYVMYYGHGGGNVYIDAEKCKSSNGKIRYVDYVSAIGPYYPYFNQWSIGISCF